MNEEIKKKAASAVEAAAQAALTPGKQNILDLTRVFEENSFNLILKCIIFRKCRRAEIDQSREEDGRQTGSACGKLVFVCILYDSSRSYLERVKLIFITINLCKVGDVASLLAFFFFNLNFIEINALSYGSTVVT